jgi:hypothetical protein
VDEEPERSHVDVDLKVASVETGGVLVGKKARIELDVQAVAAPRP